MGFLISLTPLTCDLMGWRGAGGTGASDMFVDFLFCPKLSKFAI